MEYMTPNQVARLIPPRPAKKKTTAIGLIDTRAWIRHVGRVRFRPIFATQGSPHSDAIVAKGRNRHLVVCAGPNSRALILLNGHVTHRRAWLGLGIAKDNLFLAAAVIPMQRWKDLSERMSDLLAWQTVVQPVTETMKSYQPSVSDLQRLAASVAQRAYLPGNKTAKASALYVEEGTTLRDACFEMFGRILKGNIEASTGTRKLKGLKGPDAILYASNAIWTEAVDLLYRRNKLTGPHVPYPSYSRYH